MRFRKVSFTGVGVLLGVLFLLAAACSGGDEATVTETAAAPTPKPKPQELVVGTAVQPRKLDGALTNSRGDHLVIVNNMEGLVTTGADLVPGVASLAESWTMVGEAAWEFKLRPNVKFHDGSTVTAKDVAYVFERIINPDVKSNWRSSVRGLKPVVVDESTVRLSSEKPLPTLLQTVARAGISPRAHVENNDEAYATTNPMGTGPYKFVEWKKDVHIKYERFQDYWGQNAFIPSIVFRPITEEAVRVAAVKTGQIQIAVNVPYDDVAALEAEKGVNVVKQPSLTAMGYILNAEAGPAPLKDKRVRQALNHAVDRDLLIKTVMLGNGIRLRGQPTSDFYVGYSPYITPYEYNLDKAKQLLHEAGWGGGFDVDLVFPAGYYVKGKELSEALAGELYKVGVNVTVKSLEFRPWIRHISGNKPGIIAHGTNVPPDAHFLVSPFLPGGYFTYWENKEFETLVAKAANEVNPDVRKKLYHDAFMIMRDEASKIFLWQVINVYAVDSRLTGVQLWPDERVLLASAQYE